MNRHAYLDASALVKLIVRERESRALVEALAPATPVTTSVVAAVEVVRAARATGRAAQTVDRALRIIDGCDLVELDSAVRSSAALVDPHLLRTLDAIHLASALSVQEHLDAFVTYDRRLAEAAAAIGLPVSSPGSDLAH